MDRPGEDGEPDSNVFITALAAYALSFTDTAPVREMREKALAFLVSEREPAGVWRYWTAGHPQRRAIPPDLDDTCCVAFILRRYGMLKGDSTKITLANRNEDGLFLTWVLPRMATLKYPPYWLVALKDGLFAVQRYFFWKYTEAEPDDVDGVVNANVLLYLGDRPETPASASYLLKILEEGREACCDKWHLNRFTFYYMVSRACYNGVKSLRGSVAPITERILASASDDGQIGAGALDTALAACSLLNFNIRDPVLDRAVEFLINTQSTEGNWPRAVFYFGGPKKVNGWGSASLTTALCFEALVRYSQIRRFITP